MSLLPRETTHERRGPFREQEEQPLLSENRADETGTTVLPAHLIATSLKGCKHTEEKTYMNLHR